MEASFKRAVEKIFQNWTALTLSMQHSRVHNDAPAEIFADFVNYMVNYCLYENNADQFAIADALDDIMDQEFDTICEDDSTHEVAIVLHKFAQLGKNGNWEAFEEEYQKLPVAATSSACGTSVGVTKSNKTKSETPGPETPMEQESEWTEVKGRRKH